MTQELQGGIHISFNKTLYNTVKEAIKYDFKSIQFFCGNPYSPKRTRITDEDIEKTNELLQKHPMHIFTHYPYVINLCGSVKEIAWDLCDCIKKCKCENDIKDEDIKLPSSKFLFGLSELEYEVNMLAKLTNAISTGVVIHPGSYANTNKGIKAIAKSINHLSFNSNSKLLLENCAGEGTKIYKNLSELKCIYKFLSKKSRQHTGVCIDTAHLQGVGEYDFSKNDEIDRFITEFMDKIGIDRLKLIHLNDSKAKLGSRKDLHENLGEGEIWKDNTDTLLYLLEKIKYLEIPLVLETPSKYIDRDIEIIQNI